MFTLFYCLLDMSCGECAYISLYFMCCSVDGSVCLMCCVFDSFLVNCLVTICLGVVVVLLLNVIEVWVEVLCWIHRVWYSKECACCACDPSVHLSIPSIGFVYVYVCRKLTPRLRV